MRKKPIEPEQNWCACAVCFVMTGGERKPSVSVANGYAVCADHVALVSKKSFDIFSLQTDRSSV